MDLESVVDQEIDPEDLRQAEQTYFNQKSRGEVSARATFTYAHCLIQSKKSDVQKGVELLEALIKKDEADMVKRDYLYYLALANTRLKNYDRALNCLSVILSVEPNNVQASELKHLVDRRMRKDGLLGGLIIGGAAVAGGAALLAAGLFAVARGSSKS